MIGGRARAISLAALGTILLAASADAAELTPSPEERWLRIESAHVAIVTDLDEAQARRIASDATLLVATLEAIVGRHEPHAPSHCSTLILFRDRGRFVAYRQAIMGDDVRSGGFTVPSTATTWVIPELPHRASDARSVYRDLIRNYIARHLPSAPPWLRTGLAETIGTFQQNGRVASTAYPRREHLRWLARNRESTVSEVIDGTNPGAIDPAAYDAESWVVTQLLVFEDLDGRVRLQRYLASLDADPADSAAFDEAFGRDPETVGREFRGWFSRRKITPWEESVAELNADAGDVVALSRAETLVTLGDLLARSGSANRARAIELYDQAIAAEPDGILGHARLGIALADAGRPGDAIPHLEIATRSGIDDPVPYQLLGDALLDVTPNLAVQFGPYAPPPPDAVRRARESYEGSVAIDPGRAAAWSGMARTWVFEIGDVSKGIDAATRALTLDPDQADAALSLVLLNLKRNDLDAANTALEMRLRPLETDSLTRTAERAVVAWKLQRADALARTGRLSEARALIEEVAAKADDPELRERLAIDLDAIARTEETIRLNGIYNDAVRATNDFDYETALRLVDQVLAEARDPALRKDAERLREKIWSYMRK